MARGRLLIGIAALVALCAPVLAIPQTVGGGFDILARRGVFARDRNVAVQDRAHPEWGARGLRLGGLVAYPSIEVSARATDNLYATATRTASDGVFHLRPALVVRSERPDRRLTAFAVIDRSMFPAHSSESTTDYALGAPAAAETPGPLSFEAIAGFARKTEPRFSPDSPPSALIPVRYDLAEGRFGFAVARNRLRLSARLAVTDVAFDDVRASSGATLAQAFRDRTEGSATLRAEYALQPAASVFVAGSVLDRSYRNQASPLVDRSSSGSRIEAGASFDSSRLVRGEVAAGYLQQDYRGRYASVSGPSVRMRVDAFPTQLTTIGLTATRAMEDSVIPSAGGYLASTVKAEVHHELLRNLMLQASGAYEGDSYRGLDSRDRRTLVSAGFRYLMNRGAVVTARLEREGRRSAGAQRGAGFVVDRATLGVTLRC